MKRFLQWLFGRKEKTRYVFPKEIRSRCQAALNECRRICKENNVNVSEKRGSVTVVLEPGTNKFPNGWARKIGGEWMMMHTDEIPFKSAKHFITIYHDPNDKQVWKDEALQHEFAHPFLERNEGIYAHDSRLVGKLWGWKG